MPGKLPIDQARATDNALGIYADHEQRFAEQQATHRRLGNLSEDLRAASREDVTQEDA